MGVGRPVVLGASAARTWERNRPPGGVSLRPLFPPPSPMKFDQMTRLKTNLKFIVLGEVINRDESSIVVTRVGVVIVP